MSPAAEVDHDDGALPTHEGVDMPNPTGPDDLNATLTRIEVKVSESAKDITSVLEKVTGVGAEVVVHRGQIVVIQSEVQQLQSDAKAAAQAVIDAETARKSTAELLKEATEKTLKEAKAADDKKVLDAKTLVEQATSTWLTPMRLAAIFGTVFTGAGVLIAALVALRSFGAG